MKLQNTLRGLICEIASVDSVVNAIKNKQKVVIYYDGDEPGGRGLREVEPVCLGTSKAGNKVLRAWANFNPNGDKSMTSIIIIAKF